MLAGQQLLHAHPWGFKFLERQNWSALLPDAPVYFGEAFFNLLSQPKNKGIMALISLIHPSRGRPKKAHATADEWIAKAGVEVDYMMSIDYSDPLRKEYYDFPFKKNFGITCEDNYSVVEATNYAVRAYCKGDIIIYVSDDFRCPDDWGKLIKTEFLKYPNQYVLLKVDDCLQGFHIPVLTIPMMNRALYNKLGYFWHPEYKSMFVDQDLFETCKKLNCIKYAPHLKFPHEHVSIGKAPDDETYRRSAANWNQGEQLFLKRKAAGFPV